jgi:hypothetical protein
MSHCTGCYQQAVTLPVERMAAMVVDRQLVVVVDGQFIVVDVV